MFSKETRKYIVFRLAFLLIPFLAIFLMYFFTYEPATETGHYNGGPMGYAFLLGLLLLFWTLYMFIEIIYFLIKKQKPKATINLFSIIIVVIIMAIIFA